MFISKIAPLMPNLPPWLRWARIRVLFVGNYLKIASPLTANEKHCGKNLDDVFTAGLVWSKDCMQTECERSPRSAKHSFDFWNAGY
ncbi:hypothetical protein Rcae01_04171 [Novipirellula caenicola]|uniref:Uncharacterized protein n=1 Tax=Novipirellula caenicola TaxID=1536901 RepID=A0ABP9VU96_9BACT